MRMISVMTYFQTPFWVFGISVFHDDVISILLLHDFSPAPMLSKNLFRGQVSATQVVESQ